jgi:hypothetical protein
LNAGSLNLFCHSNDTVRTSSVSDPHSLYADPDPAFLVNADPDPNPALNLNADPDPGEMLPNIF